MLARPFSTVVLALAAIACTTTRSHAEVECCDTCGCSAGCQKVCRLVCEEKKVDVICWGCKCEQFCMPGPSKPGCKHCAMVCQSCNDGCDCTAPHAEPKQFVWRDWIPGCAKLHTKKKLMQKIETKTVKTYKWVVEDLCPNCEVNCDCADVVTGEAIPPPPVAEARLKYGVKLMAMLPDSRQRK